MRILQVHNGYQSGLSGEDTVVEWERALLARHGHTVTQHLVSNAGIRRSGLAAMGAGMNAIWSWRAWRVLRQRLDEERPDLVHVHNTYAMLSPSIFWAIHAAGIPCVLTLHNYRLTCATSVLYRDGQICEACVGRVPFAALTHRCRYAESLAAGLTIAATQWVHQTLGTYRTQVQAFIALTAFQRSLMARAGVPADRIHVKPNAITAPELAADVSREAQVVFVGQVLRVKGVDLLLEAWQQLAHREGRLVIIGDGIEREELARSVPASPRIVWLGRQERGRVLEAIQRSKFLVVPSRWYEGFPMVIAEALALGTPVIAPDHGPFPSIITDGREGLLFSIAQAGSLTTALEQALAMPAAAWQAYSQAARATYAGLYTPETNYQQLMAIYEAARARISTGRAD